MTREFIAKYLPYVMIPDLKPDQASEEEEGGRHVLCIENCGEVW